MEINSNASIIRSMNKDTNLGAKKVSGSFNVSEEEALLLAKMQTESSKKRKYNLLAILSVVIVFVAITLLSIPDKFFISKDTGIESIVSVQKFLPVNNVYQINLPTASDLQNFRNSTFANTTGISNIEIISNGSIVSFNNLAPFLPERFITEILAANVIDYMYGFTGAGTNGAMPYLAIVVEDQKLAENIMLNLERVLYTDMLNMLKLQDNPNYEILSFENYDSVRMPARFLRSDKENVLIMYGFPMDNVLLITTNPASYEMLRNRMLLGY